MFAQFRAKRAAVRAAARGFNHPTIRVLAGVTLAAIGLGGCLQASPPLVGADPADPSEKVAGAGYRSTTAPYTKMRPTAPTSWRGSDAPSPKTDK